MDQLSNRAELRLETDDRLLLREFTHRTGNELAMAVAAMRLVAAARGPTARRRLVDEAIARLEAASAVHVLLAARTRRETDVGELVRDLCAALAYARPGAARSSVLVEVDPIRVPGELARRLALIAAELVTNSFKYALEGRAGALRVGVDLIDDGLRLIVSDDGPGMRTGASPHGTGWGREIVAELVGRAGGTLSVDTGRSGTVVRVVLPMDRWARTDDYAF